MKPAMPESLKGGPAIVEFINKLDLGINLCDLLLPDWAITTLKSSIRTVF